jgi:glycosyltransferase involved in cell wall biosynthesis
VNVRVLVVSYAFPPIGGAGVQRMAKLVKYLPGHGVVPSVLTVHGGSVPLHDASLARDVPSEVEVLRARTLEPAYGAKRLAWQASATNTTHGPFGRSLGRLLGLGRKLLVPDPQILWLPGAAFALAKRLAARDLDAVLISGPPFSQFLLALLAEPLLGTPVILDYRDEWTTTAAYEMGGSVQVAAWLERMIVRRASAITTATEEFRSTLLERFPFLDPERVVTIPNGYDPEDFSSLRGEPPLDRFVLGYAGTVFRLTSADGFLAGLRLFHEREPLLARSLEVRFAGRIVETEAAAFEGSEALGVRRLGYLEHTAALQTLAESHAALCLLSELPGVERIYPAKIFEIMRLGRPCLALTPEGALATLVRRHRLGEVVPPGAPERIAATLARWVSDFRDGKFAEQAGPVDIERFDRSRQAGAFADVLRGAKERSATGFGGLRDATLREGEDVRRKWRISPAIAHVVDTRANDV